MNGIFDARECGAKGDGVQGEIMLGDLTSSEGGSACDAQTLDSSGLTNIVRKKD
jgi:hypothetical protein